MIQENESSVETEYRGIYLVSFSSGKDIGKRLLFTCSLDDAQKFCSDDRTKSKQSHSWMTVFNALPEDLSAKNFMKDDGRFDEVIKELGIKVKYWNDFDSTRE